MKIISFSTYNDSGQLTPFLEKLKNPKKAKEYGQGGFEYAQKKLLWEKVAKETLRAYKNTLKSFFQIQ